MSNLGPLTLVFSSDRRFTVSSLKQVSVALSLWPDAHDPELETLRELTRDAIAGRIAPRVAFDAFALKAHRRGLVEPVPKSEAWEAALAAVRQGTLRAGLDHHGHAKQAPEKDPAFAPVRRSKPPVVGRLR